MRLVLFAAFVAALAHAQAGSPFQYAVKGVYRVDGGGSWDHITVDPDGHRLFVPRFTHTMVLDSRNGKLLADIPGQKLSHGVAIVPKDGRGFISDGDAGDLVVFDLKTYSVLGRVAVEDDADGVLYDNG